MDLVLSLFITCVFFMILDFTGMLDRIANSLLKSFSFCYDRSKDEITKVPEDKKGR